MGLFSWGLVDTSARRPLLTADQGTREETGASVTGLAVSRIVRPLQACRILNLDEPSSPGTIPVRL